MPTIRLALSGLVIMVVITVIDIYSIGTYAKYAGSAITVVEGGENLFIVQLLLATKPM